MLDSEYKAEKEAFVTGLTGSSFSHINLISSVALTSVAFYSALWRYTDKKPSNLLSQWLILVLPLLLSMTLFSNKAAYFSPLLLALTLVIVFLFGNTDHRETLPSQDPQSPIQSKAGFSKDAPAKRSPSIPPLPALTTYRAHMMLMTILAILAVDFPVFDRSLAKCETFGSSLMDVGVGSFVFSQGLVSAIPIVKDISYLQAPLGPKIYNVLRKCVPVLLLGIVRVLMVKSSGYPEHESEYGRHWNFFFTLSLVPVIQVLTHPLVLRLPIAAIALAVALAHQILLTYGLETYALEAPRLGFVSANKEGIISLTGYFAMHLIGLSTGTVILPSSPTHFRRSKKMLLSPKTTGPEEDSNAGAHQGLTPYNREDDKTFIELVSYSFIWWTLLGLSRVLNWDRGVSRRLANWSYIIWVAAYNTSFIAGYYMLDLIFFSSPSNTSRYSSVSGLKVPVSKKAAISLLPDWDGRSPTLFQAINKNSLVIFLVANLGTGLVNMSIQTMHTTGTPAIMILSIYSIALCCFAWFFQNRRLSSI